MHTTYNVHLGYRFAIITFNYIQHLIGGQLPTIFLMRIQAAVRTKIATEYADVGGFDMKIPVEVSGVAMYSFPDGIGQRANKREAPFFKKDQAFIVIDPLVHPNFFGNSNERRFGAGGLNKFV
jgi:hypothetical protein